nr:Intraflagellar transport protein like [Ipomoea batatas]GMD20262.1 Intraflagellar transport protein like [Ipomoea batatas]GME15108.1 Intraflagellar transport protein like [Ipomoea batatas]GME18161.1 Intraflagellar transport protein like [Ipomoea batatas]
MGVKVAAAAATCLHWSQPSVSRSPSFAQTLASAISSPSQKRRSLMCSEGVLLCRFMQRQERSGFSGANSPNRRVRLTRRACSGSQSSFWNEEFSFGAMFSDNQSPFDAAEPPDWAGREEMIPASIEMKANRVDLPLSLRIIKRKKQWEKGLREAGESAYCSVKKAFSNMVLIIRELNTYILQMREMLSYEELQGVLIRVEKEIHASFVWLFQQVFSHTPTLMVYVMILLANFSVHSMASSASLQPYIAPPIESVSIVYDNQHFLDQKFDSSAIKTFSVSSSNGNSTTIDGSNGGGGGKYRPVANGTDGDGGFDRQLSSMTRSSEDESVSGHVAREDELRLWDSIVDEASRMQSVVLRDESLDHEAIFVSPVYAKIESDDYSNYFRTEMMYQLGLAQEPNNTMLLANYAQFLHLVAQDYDRAEEYFKRATGVEPRDADALNKYATFLWQVRKDLWGAEQRYQDAVAAAEPNNSFYAACYAHFLWSTGGEDTCFPLDTSHE